MSYSNNSSKTSLGATKSRSRSRSPTSSTMPNRSKTPPPRPPRPGTSSPSNYQNRNKTPPKLPPRTHIPRSLRPLTSRFKSPSTSGASQIRSILKTTPNSNMRPQGFSSASARFANSRLANSSTSLKQSARFLYQPKRRPNASSTSKPPSEFNLWSQSKFRNNKSWQSNPNLSQKLASQWPINSSNSYPSTPFQQPFPHPAYLPPGGHPMLTQPSVVRPGQEPPAISYAAGAPSGYYSPSTPLTPSLSNPSSYAPETSAPYSSSRGSYKPPGKDVPDPDPDAHASEGDDGEGQSEGNPCYQTPKKIDCPNDNTRSPNWKELYRDYRDSTYLTTNTVVSRLVPFGKPYQGYKKAIRTCSARCIKWDHMEFRFPGDTCCTCVCRRRQR